MIDEWLLDDEYDIIWCCMMIDVLWWWCNTMMMLYKVMMMLRWWSLCVVAFVVVGVAFVVSSTYAYEAMAWKYGTTMAWKYGTTMALIGTTMRGIIAWHVQLWHICDEMVPHAYCIYESVMFHCRVGVVAWLVVDVALCRVDDDEWCDVMLVELNLCMCCCWLLLFVYMTNYIFLIMNVNLTPSVEIAALWASADNQE